MEALYTIDLVQHLPLSGHSDLVLQLHDIYNHHSSFKDQRKMNATELSKAVWDYKNRGIKPLISWSIICKVAAFKSGAKCCNLCLAEKLAILQADQRTLLNKRSEFISKCRHWTKFKLKNINLC